LAGSRHGLNGRCKMKLKTALKEEVLCHEKIMP